MPTRRGSGRTNRPVHPTRPRDGPSRPPARCPTGTVYQDPASKPGPAAARLYPHPTREGVPTVTNQLTCLGSPLSRRTFLHVGVVGGLGLTLDQFFRLQAARRRRPAAKKGPKAESFIHIFLPGGIAHQEIVRPEAERPDRVPRRDGRHPDQARRRLLQRVPEADRPGRRQDHRLPVDDARRGGPRARHAQHVHRLPAQPGPRPSRAWAASSATSSGVRNNLPPYVCVPSHADQLTPAAATCRSAFAPFSLGSDPANAGFTRAGPRTCPAASTTKRFTTPQEHARGGQRPLRRQGEVRQPRRRWTRSTSGPTA